MRKDHSYAVISDSILNYNSCNYIIDVSTDARDGECDNSNQLNV